MEYGLIGESLKHSWSKEIHNMIGDYDYEILGLPANDFDSFIKSRGFKGLNITIPYKQKIIPYCKSLSKSAKRIGSVNTVIVDNNGELQGFNTDYDGFIYMYNNAGISFAGKSVIILGSGGTGKTAKVATEDMGAAKVTVISRTGHHTYDDIRDFSNTDIIINTTPVGMYPNNRRSLVDLGNFSKCEAVIDVIYNPMKTQLLMDAEDRGIKYTSGLPMLVAQAKFASDIFQGEGQKGESPNNHITKQIIDKIKFDNSNAILIGMPGSGKTCIGRVVAEKLERSFVDIDTAVTEITGLPISDIFDKFGEEHFRDIESDTIKKYGKEKGLVISVGGGGILRKETRFDLRQNGYIIWVQRDLDKLETAGRPLSKNRKSLKRILQGRKEIYESISQFKVDNNGDDYHMAAMGLVRHLCRSGLE